MSLLERVRAQLLTLQQRGLDRTCPPISDRRGPQYRLDGQPVIGFCSNDYLGLADAPLPTPVPPLGAASSRLICGDLPPHRDLERQLADHVGYPDAVLFPSGYQLNVGVIPSLIDGTDRVYSDALVHASIIDGLRLAHTRPIILSHCSPPPSTPVSVTWWFSESLFSMDGDLIDFDAIRRHQAAGGVTYLDDAHAFGLYPGGLGAASHHGLRPTVLVATLSKALGGTGAFIASDPEICQWIRSRARSFVFSTAPSPALAAALSHALERLRGPEGDLRRERLWANISRLSQQLGLRTSHPSPIFPILIGPNESAREISRALLALGWHVQAIRPPTVPVDTARLRITISADHTPEHIDRFASDLMGVLSRHGFPLQLHRPRPV